ncbi:hypothetical protein DY000_02038821 [Brassica cretica]|uniref:SWIM-type domain-containing protein n=1 Tax=Brassica cretica TaxID=69181 RepID=A0ABQ7BHS8_BRACR|nr:hypothetical protein DY000_02038821 [Brassica cretica]
MHIYSSCGFWKSSVRKGWSFLADEAKGGRLLNLDGSSTFEKLKLMVSEDFGIDLTLINLELSYLPSELINTLEPPPVIISNDRQVKKFLTYVKTKPSTSLCVCLQSKDENPNREARVNFNNQASDAPIREEDDTSNENSDVNSGETYFDEQDIERDESDDEKMSDIKGSKGDNATFEICAMKYNFDYKLVKSDTKIWYIRCTDEDCSWRVRAEELKGGAKCNDIIELMRGEHGIEVSKSLAWDAREYAINTMRGIPETGGAKCNDIIELMRGEHGIEVSKSLAWDAREYAINTMTGKYLIEADVRKWARCQFPGFRYDIRSNNPAESMNFALRSSREFTVIPLLDIIREMITRWVFECRTLSSKNSKPLTTYVEKKIDRRIQKGNTLIVYPINDYRFLVCGDKIECTVDLVRRTCSCGKFDLLKIPCRHAVKAGFSVGRPVHSLTDEKYTNSSWISVYEERINPISVPEVAWIVPEHVENAKFLSPESRRAAGRRKKRRYETVKVKIRSQGSKGSTRRKCSRCEIEGHNRSTCNRAI